MCGIVAYLGDKKAAPILLEGLKRLEYRGYDSAGIAVQNIDGLEIIKRSGKIHNLAAVVNKKIPQGTIGIEQLAEHPVMLTPRGTTFRDALDQELAASGVRLTSAAEVDGLRLLASLAYQGYAPALLPASAVSGYPEGDWSLVHVEGLARRSVGLVRNRRTTPSMPSRAARDVVLEVIREIAPHQPGIHVTLGG